MEKSKIIHYSRSGYNGNYTYTSACGEEVNSHSSTEECSVDPKEANCKKCLKAKKYKTDLADFLSTPAGMKRRIYIESDILRASEFRNAQRAVSDLLDDTEARYTERVFNHVIPFAWHHLEETWQAVKKAEEIYATSSLMPLIGGSYMGAPVIFNGMCERAVREGVKEKSVIILNSLSNIHWDMINVKLMKQAFKKNDLFMYDDDYTLIKVDVSKIKVK